MVLVTLPGAVLVFPGLLEVRLRKSGDRRRDRDSSIGFFVLGRRP